MPGDSSLRLLLAVVMVAQTTASTYFIRRARASATLLRGRQAGAALTSALVFTYFAYGVGLIAFLIDPSRMAWSTVGLSVSWRWVGALPLLAGGALFVRGLFDLGAGLTISASTKEGHELETEGSYGWIRHPVYSALFAQTVGVSLMSANWFVALCGAGFCGLLAFRTGAEERDLVAEFGDRYMQYQRRVGRFVPKIRRSD